MKHLLLICALFFTFEGFSQSQLQNEASGSIAFTSDKFIQLSEALPAEKYGWKPTEGVRSIAEVFAHVISANYYFASKLGAEIPKEINMETLEKELTKKEDILAALKKSYEVVDKAIKNTKDEDLVKKVEYPFPGEFTNMTSILIILSHSNEHLGQLITYARMNNITPPWSKNEE